MVRVMTGQFDAPGDDAAALLRAQELGCLPEAVLALVVLTDYRIVGAPEDGGMLQIRPEWPAAWRVHATRCHRALAAGCNDDIDVVLRIFSEWQRSPDPSGWCATWWIDPEMLTRIETDVAAVFASLATAGPLGLRHPVDGARAPQVRRALAETLGGAEHERIGPDRYRRVGSEGEVSTLSPAAVVTPGERFVALYRDPATGGLEHLISLDAPPTATDDLLAPVRAEWPVGSIADIETLGAVAAGRIIVGMSAIQRGFPCPEGTAPGPAAPRDDVPELIAAPTYASAPIDAALKMRVRIIGYRIEENGGAVLVVDPLEPGAPLDPADHPDLGTWDDIEVVVRGVTPEHGGPLLELARADGLGSFYVPPAAGLDAHDAGFASRLIEGARLTGRVIPEPPIGAHLTVSLLPVALRHLEATVADQHRPIPAVVVARDGAQAILTVELVNRDPTNGMSHRFSLPYQRLAGGLDPAPGSELDVVLRPDRSQERRRLGANAELIRFARRNGDTFVIEDGWLGLAPSPPQIPAILALLSLSDSSPWEREVVWMYEDNLHLEVAMAGERGNSLVARAASESPGFLLPAPARSTSPGQAGTAATGTERSGAPTDLPKLVAWLPPGGPERVMGRNGAALAELRAGPGVVAVDLEGDIVTVIGESGRTVRSVLSEIQRLILPAKGKIIVPPGQGRRLIGIDGTTVRAIEARTGCLATPPQEDGDLWSVEGPSSQAVKEFIRLAAEQVAGVAGRVTGVEDLEVLEDTTIPGGERRPAPRPAPPPAAPEPPAEPAPDPAAEQRVEEPEAPPSHEPASDREGGTDADEITVGRAARRIGRQRSKKAPKTERTAEVRTRETKTRAPSDIVGWLGRALLVLVAAAAVVGLILYIIPLVRGDQTPASPNGSLDGTATLDSLPGSNLVELVDASAFTADACWLAVMATSETQADAATATEQLATIGLEASIVASDIVPGWATGGIATVVAVETPRQAADAVARAALVGYRGVAVESTTEGCSTLGVVPGGASLGFVDVPVNHPANAAIAWMANTGLARTCNPPIGDQFCPSDIVTVGELNEALAAVLDDPPPPIERDDVAPATAGDARHPLGMETALPNAPLSRAELAEILLQAYRDN